jgi:hypothetical protein
MQVAAGGDAVEADALYVYLENQVVALGSIERLAIAELAESSPKVGSVIFSMCDTCPSELLANIS